jgi:hypothetical protein
MIFVLAVAAYVLFAVVLFFFGPRLDLTFWERVSFVWASQIGAITLAEARKRYQDPLERGVIETILEAPGVMERMSFEGIGGNSFKYNEEATLPGVAFRAVNAGYTESTGTVSAKTESLAILGGFSDVDPVVRRWTQTGQPGSDLNVENAAALAKAIRMKFTDTFFNGDIAVDANAFDGLKKRLTGGQVLAAATNGLPVVGASDSDRHAFFDKLDEVLALVIGPDSEKAIYLNDLILAKIQASARRLGVGPLESQAMFEGGPRISFYRQTPLIDPGYKSDGTTRILPQTETQGTDTSTSSIYVVKFSGAMMEPGVLGIENPPLSVDDRGEVDLSDKVVERIFAEWGLGIALFNSKSAARLTGVDNT